jgi:hypothetical protein
MWLHATLPGLICVWLLFAPVLRLSIVQPART